MNKKMSRIVDENPFYKMPATLDLFQQGNKLQDSVTQGVVYNYLDAAWKECGADKVKKELFFSLIFSLGDISNREHNIFRKRGIKNPDQGGQSKRKVFSYCLKWMLERTPAQFYTFLPIIGEYYNLGGMMMYQLTTDRWKGTLKDTFHLPVDIATVTSHIAKVLQSTLTTENEKTLWARWLPHVPSPNRVRHYTITEKNIKAFKKGGHEEAKVGDTIKVKKAKKDHTQKKDAWVIGFIRALSEKMDWRVSKHSNSIHFDGYRAFRKKYLQDTEAALFSSGRIVELDKTQFYAWLDKQPSGARYRVACRLVSKDKSGNLGVRDKWKLKTGENMGQLYMDWLKSKEKHQEKLASLTTEEKKAMNPVELKQLEKAAKVNVGGDSLLDLIAEIASGKLSLSELNTKAFSLLEKITIGLPVLIIADISGSMSSASVEHKGMKFTAKAMAQLATTVFLLKNPDEEAGQFFVRFDDHAEVIVSGQQAQKQGVNKFMAKQNQVVGTLVDKTKPFSDNLANVSKYIIARNGTHLSEVSSGFKAWVEESAEFKSQKIEQINKYPVMLVISDGDLNNSSNAAASFQVFQSDMRQWFGWEGVVVLWDVKQSAYGDGKKFESVPNLMYFGGTNMGILDQIFRNIHDLDVVDQYLPLKALHSSNRYLPVQELVL